MKNQNFQIRSSCNLDHSGMSPARSLVSARLLRAFPRATRPLARRPAGFGAKWRKCEILTQNHWKINENQWKINIFQYFFNKFRHFLMYFTRTYFTSTCERAGHPHYAGQPLGIVPKSYQSRMSPGSSLHATVDVNKPPSTCWIWCKIEKMQDFDQNYWNINENHWKTKVFNIFQYF